MLSERATNGAPGTRLVLKVAGGKRKSYGSSIKKPEEVLTRNPIIKVLSVMHGCRVRFLLMGGQACVVYGGSEFSRDTDIAILPDRKNLNHLDAALSELHAELIAVPRLTLESLLKGHAIHFRCKHPDAMNMRIDIMSVLRNAPPFETLWKRRTTMELSNGLIVNVVSLPDLVAIKKTQRDKDWSHVRRLVEAHYLENREKSLPEHVRFWLAEARTPEILRQLATENPKLINELQKQRELFRLLPNCSDDELSAALIEEEKKAREADRAYWRPLLEELEKIRHTR